MWLFSVVPILHAFLVRCSGSICPWYYRYRYRLCIYIPHALQSLFILKYFRPLYYYYYYYYYHHHHHHHRHHYLLYAGYLYIFSMNYHLGNMLQPILVFFRPSTVMKIKNMLLNSMW